MLVTPMQHHRIPASSAAPRDVLARAVVQERSGDFWGRHRYDYTPVWLQASGSGDVQMSGHRSASAIRSLETASLSDAVKAAARLSANAAIADPEHAAPGTVSPAVAVMRASDGAYYATYLLAWGTATHGPKVMTIDGESAQQVRERFAARPAELHALVGAHSVVEFPS